MTATVACSLGALCVTEANAFSAAERKCAGPKAGHGGVFRQFTIAFGFVSVTIRGGTPSAPTYKPTRASPGRARVSFWAAASVSRANIAQQNTEPLESCAGKHRNTERRNLHLHGAHGASIPGQAATAPESGRARAPFPGGSAGRRGVSPRKIESPFILFSFFLSTQPAQQCGLNSTSCPRYYKSKHSKTVLISTFRPRNYESNIQRNGLNPTSYPRNYKSNYNGAG